MASASLDEKAGLLRNDVVGERRQQRRQRRRHLLNLVTPCLLFLAIAFHSTTYIKHNKPCKNDRECLVKAERVLSKYPIIDGHVDVPIVYRYLAANQVDKIDLSKENATDDVDIPRLRKGRVGGMFWSAYVDCAPSEGENFTTATWRVRDTLEQIDTAKLVIDQYPETFEAVETASQARKALKKGKVASFIGIEGAHQLGNSLSTLRQYRKLGVRYMTLSHICSNAFADSCGLPDRPAPRLHGGLSALGKDLVKEMNRIGLIVDASHTSSETAADALTLSEAPIMWSHSNAKALFDHPRNIPDELLKRIGNARKGDTSSTGVRAGDAVIMVNFVPYFLAANASDVTLQTVADQIEHIAHLAGKETVGLGADFDGMGPSPRVQGLEDVSKYPLLIAELLKLGWSEREVAGLASENILRILDKCEKIAAKIQKSGAKPITTLYDRRPDLPYHFPDSL